ncbi:MAG: HAD-IIIC family phosphatase [Planctomycetota bacterium]|jgi:FkbH-like protein
MVLKDYSCLLISDFNLTNFAGYLSNDEGLPRVEATLAPFGQVIPVLTAGNPEVWQKGFDFAIIWTQPEAIIESFKRVLDYQSPSIERMLSEVDEYSSALLNIQDKVNFAFVPTWVFPSFNRGMGLLDMKEQVGVANTLMRMNLRLCENLGSSSGFYVPNAQRWIENAGKNAFNPKLWYMGKIPFGNEVFKEAGKDIKCFLDGISGNSRKIIILDLDNTLWGGIVGDEGWENIRLGGHDPLGEAFVDFQKALKSLTNRGILLGIVSKNEESIALEAINRHPEMVLKVDDFAGWKINWKDKANNIVELVSELNLGIQSVVFIDDNPAERAWVSDSLPEVYVPEWPENKLLHKSELLKLRCFDVPSVSEEDARRPKLYAAERQRVDLRKNMPSMEQWLRELNIKIKVESLSESNRARTAQLLNKTNQMNLSTRRMTEAELVGWERQDAHKLWTFRVSDRFGNYGLTGIVSLAIEGKEGRIADFVLSCRVMGRKVEDAMVYTAIEGARAVGLEKVYAKYLPTAKNKPCLEFWMGSGFNFVEEDNCFVWDVKKNFVLPDIVEIGCSLS